MTSAKLVTAPAEGHGLIDRLTDPMYHALTVGQPPESIVALVVLKPVGLGQRETKNGRHRHVVFEATKLEPILDANQSNELRYLAQALYEQRTSTGEQRTLPLGLGADEERRLAVIERIEDWSGEKGMTGGELEAAWRQHFGISPDADFSFGDSGIPGDYRKASTAYLLQFGYANDAIEREASAPAEAVEDDEADVDTEDDTAPEPAAEVVDEPTPIARGKRGAK